ncbi:Uncharacterised protein [Mycobacteroides abscessus subsp. abscessus]|nr:Uncharacterised protein [Mycobacteroides abscessus subsp. abscessus]SKR04458.1 Uncharacterised protein [Mycobacteroides abscessus subsp. abscessus]SKU14008.1 Uncharacterised protein [Mycobacteroides abscessus subsp. abscessus]SKX48856.1 Uncharacterised protein [Mycobacteroides abscessus subsp. abscessus]
MHRFVHAPALGDEPIVDAAERGEHGAADSSLFGHLADGGLLGGLTLFDMPLGQRPQHASAPVGPPDEGSDLTVLGAVDAGDDQAAGRGFTHRAQ